MLRCLRYSVDEFRIVASCDSFNEDLPECRLSVKFKYDYNMEFADAFHAQVDKVELYVFDKNGNICLNKLKREVHCLPAII